MAELARYYTEAPEAALYEELFAGVVSSAQEVAEMPQRANVTIEDLAGHVADLERQVKSLGRKIDLLLEARRDAEEDEEDIRIARERLAEGEFVPWDQAKRELERLRQDVHGHHRAPRSARAGRAARG